ncbi:MAG: hypothetical protein ACTHWQ_06365, partial [Sphingobacterium sp.]
NAEFCFMCTQDKRQKMLSLIADWKASGLTQKHQANPFQWLRHTPAQHCFHQSQKPKRALSSELQDGSRPVVHRADTLMRERK